MKNSIYIVLILIVGCSLKPKDSNEKKTRNTTMENIISNEELVLNNKKEFLKSIKELDIEYEKSLKEIFYSKADNCYKYIISINGEREFKSITDSIRISYTKEGFKRKDFQNFLTDNMKTNVSNSLANMIDPITMGYLLIKHDAGKTMFNILTNVETIQEQLGFSSANAESGSILESVDDYYYDKLQIVNDSKAIYKNCLREISFENTNDRVYFIFKKVSDSNWLLDDIKVCTLEEEKASDLELIGKSKPIKYLVVRY